MAREVVAAVKDDAAGRLNGSAVEVLLFVGRLRMFNDEAVGVFKDGCWMLPLRHAGIIGCRDCFKEESTRVAHYVEKALLKAATNLYLESVM